MSTQNYIVEITIPQGGTKLDGDVYSSVGRLSDYSGYCMDTGDRDHGWEGLSETQGNEMVTQLQRMSNHLDHINGRSLGISIRMSSKPS